MDFPVPPYPKETFNSSIKSIVADIQTSIASLPNAAYVWKLAQQKTHESLKDLSATNRSDKLNFVKRTAFPSADKEKAALELLYKSDLWGSLLASSRPTKGILFVDKNDQKTLKPVLEIPLLSKTLCDLVYQQDLLTVFNDLVLNTKVPYSMLAKLTQLFTKDKHTTPNNFTLYYPPIFSLIPTQEIYATAAGTITTNDLKFIKDSPAALLFERLTDHRKRHVVLPLGDVAKGDPDLQQTLFDRLRGLAGFQGPKEDYVIQGKMEDTMAPWYVYVFVLIGMLPKDHPLVAVWSNPNPCAPLTHTTLTIDPKTTTFPEQAAGTLMTIANVTDAPDWDWSSMYAYGDWIRKRLFRYCLEKGIALKAPLGFGETRARYLNGLVRVFAEYNELTKTSASPEMQKMFDAYLGFFKLTKTIKIKGKTGKTELYEYPNLFNTFKNVYLGKLAGAEKTTIPLPGASEKQKDFDKLVGKRAKLSEELAQILDVKPEDVFEDSDPNILKEEWDTCGGVSSSIPVPESNIVGWYKEVVDENVDLDKDTQDIQDTQAMATKIVDTLLSGWPDAIKTQVITNIVSRTQSLQPVVPASAEERIVALTGFNFEEYKDALKDIVPLDDAAAASKTFQDYDEAIQSALLATNPNMRSKIEEFFKTPITLEQLPQRAQAILELYQSIKRKSDVDASKPSIDDQDQEQVEIPEDDTVSGLDEFENVASAPDESHVDEMVDASGSATSILEEHNTLFKTKDKTLDEMKTTLAKYQEAMGATSPINPDNPEKSSQEVYNKWKPYLDQHNEFFKTNDETLDDMKATLAKYQKTIDINPNDASLQEINDARTAFLKRHNDHFKTLDETLEQVKATLAKYQEAMGASPINPDNPDKTSQEVYNEWIEFLSTNGITSQSSSIDDAKAALRSQNDSIPLNEKTSLTDNMDLPEMLQVIKGNREALQRAHADAQASVKSLIEDIKALGGTISEVVRADESLEDLVSLVKSLESQKKALEAQAKAKKEAGDKRITDTKARVQSLISKISELNNVDDDIKSTNDIIPKQLPASIKDLEELQSNLKSEESRLQNAINAKHQANIAKLNEIRDQLSQPPDSPVSPLDLVTPEVFKDIRDQLMESEKALKEAKASLMKSIESLKPIAVSNKIDTSALDNVQGKTYKDLKEAYEVVEKQIQAKTKENVEALKKEISNNIGVGSYKKTEDAEFNAKITGFEKQINAIKDTISDDALIEDLVWHLAKTAYNAYEQRDRENKLKNKRIQEAYGGIKALNILKKFGIVTDKNYNALEQFFDETKGQGQSGNTTYTGKPDDILKQLEQMQESTQNNITPELKDKLLSRIFQLRPVNRKASSTVRQPIEWPSLTEQQPVSQPQLSTVNKKAQPSSEPTNDNPHVELDKAQTSSSTVHKLTHQQPVSQTPLPPMNRKTQSTNDNPPIELDKTQVSSTVHQPIDQKPFSQPELHPMNRNDFPPLEKTLASQGDFQVVDQTGNVLDDNTNTKAIEKLNNVITNDANTIDMEVIDGLTIVNRMLDATLAIKGVLGTSGTSFSIRVHPKKLYGDVNTYWEYTDPFVFARHYIKGYIQLPTEIADTKGGIELTTQMVADALKNVSNNEFVKAINLRTSEQVLYYKDSYISHVLDLMLALANNVDFTKSNEALSQIIVDGSNALNYWPVVYSLRRQEQLPVISGSAAIDQITMILNDMVENNQFVEGVQVSENEINALNVLLKTSASLTSLPSLKTEDTSAWEPFFSLLTILLKETITEAQRQAIVSKAKLSPQRATAILQRAIDIRPVFTQGVLADARRKKLGGAQRLEELPRPDKRNLLLKSPVKERKSPSKSKPRS